MIPQNNFDEAKKSNDQSGQCIDFGKPRPTNFVKRESDFAGIHVVKSIRFDSFVLSLCDHRRFLCRSHFTRGCWVKSILFRSSRCRTLSLASFLLVVVALPFCSCLRSKSLVDEQFY